jgi:Subtilase family
VPPHAPAPGRRLWVAAILAVLAFCAPSSAGVGPPRTAAEAGLAGHEHIVIALDGNARAAALARSAGARLVSKRLQLWRLSGAVATRLLPRLRRLDAVRYAEPERPRPNGVRFIDPLATAEVGWHLYAVGADRAEPPGPGFPITIIDSGLDLGHMDFSGRPDTVALNDQSTDYADLDEYHGTLVASTAAAATNGVGAEGVYPQAALRVYDIGAPTSTSVVAGIEAALEAGPSIINLSLGGPVPTRAEFEAILLAVRSGSLVVAASGNSLQEGDPLEYPASFPHVLTVGAVDRSLLPTEFSSSGPGVDLVAPGVDIPFSHPTDATVSVVAGGTSFSAPIVTAVAAWLKTARPDLTVTQVADVLRRSAKDIARPGWDARTGFGLLDIPAALAAPTPPVDPSEPNDDVDQITRLVGRPQPSLNGAKGGNARIVAGVDSAEDPHDVYRLIVPAKRRLVATVTPVANVRAALWAASASTVVRGQTQRLAFSNRPGARGEQVAWTNLGRRPVAVFLDVAPAGPGVRSRYTAAVRIVRAPR